MRPKHRITRGLTVGMAIATGLAACDDGSDPSYCSAEVVEIRFEEASPLTLEHVRDGTFLTPSVLNECGQTVFTEAPELTWSSSAPEVVTVSQVMDEDQPRGYVVALDLGMAEVALEVGGIRAAIEVQVVPPETEASGFTVLGSGEVDLYTTDLWVHGDYGYTGSQPWSCGGSEPPCESLDGWLFVWSLLPDGGIARVDSLDLPAAKVNDVKVAADGTMAVATLERGGPAANGIVVLDVSDPAAPEVLAHHTQGLEGGVHNVWIERLDGRDYAFVVEDGGGGDGGLHILDLADPGVPVEVSLFYGGSSVVHDVYVRDGLAFVSHWDAGLIILDVGNGIRSGSPENPVEVGRVVTVGGRVHNAWYWPAGDVVFVGEERFRTPGVPGSEGVLHVVDASDLANPIEVATFGVAGDTPHNFWLDEDRQILYAAWYDAGLRAIDVGGGLNGDLAAQGRELGYLIPSGANGKGSVWAPQLHDGRIYLSDIFNGIWSVRFDG